MAASVVDFPDPVTPVTSTSPRGERAICSITGGRSSVSSAGTSKGMARNAIPSVPRC